MSGSQLDFNELSLVGKPFSNLTYYAAGTKVLTTLELPNWTVATRPTTGLNAGRTGFNTDLGTQEMWTGSGWVSQSGSAVNAPHAIIITWPTGTIVGNGIYDVALSWPYQTGTILSLVGLVGVGAFTVGVQIATVPVTGLGAVLVSSATASTTLATAANAIIAGQDLRLVITGATGSPSPATLQINYVRSATGAGGTLIPAGSASLPTSPAGLVPGSGALWNNGGVVMIV